MLGAVTRELDLGPLIRLGRGEDRTGYGSKHTEDNVFSPDESTHVVLNPKDAYLKDSKVWPAVGRIDNSYGDKHLLCTCPPIEAYAEPAPEVATPVH